MVCLDIVDVHCVCLYVRHCLILVTFSSFALGTNSIYCSIKNELKKSVLYYIYLYHRTKYIALEDRRCQHKAGFLSWQQQRRSLLVAKSSWHTG